MSNNLWPPPYQLKTNARAKRVNFRITPREGLIVTVPKRFRLHHLPAILAEHRQWIETQLSRIDLTAQHTLPLEVVLTAISETFPISYQEQLGRLCLSRLSSGELLLKGPITLEGVRRLLHRWLKLQAEKHLAPWVEALSQATGLTYSSVHFRDQQTRWGSCNAEGKINLNYKLLFLSPELAKHIILHELCHTKEMNHSARFWRLVSCFDPHWQHNRREIKNAMIFVPYWAQ